MWGKNATELKNHPFAFFIQGDSFLLKNPPGLGECSVGACDRKPEADGFGRDPEGSLAFPQRPGAFGFFQMFSVGKKSNLNGWFLAL